MKERPLEKVTKTGRVLMALARVEAVARADRPGHHRPGAGIGAVISRANDIHPRRVARLIDYLVDEGLADRRPLDRVALTPLGQRAASDLFARYETDAPDLPDVASPARYQQLSNVPRAKLETVLNKMAAEGWRVVTLAGHFASPDRDPDNIDFWVLLERVES